LLRSLRIHRFPGPEALHVVAARFAQQFLLRSVSTPSADHLQPSACARSTTATTISPLSVSTGIEPISDLSIFSLLTG
jgi:hypothetical protein